MGSFIIYNPHRILLGRSNQEMRWAEHVARMGEGRKVYRVLWESPKKKEHFKDQGVDGRMGSKWTLGRLVGGV
jgi:hypothetical protein